MNKYEKLFTPIRIGNRILKNRIEAAPAALSNLTPEGYFTDQNIATFERKANDENVNRQIYEVLQAHFSYLPDLLRTQQIRELTGFSMTAIQRWVLEKRITAILGRKGWNITRDSLVTFLSSSYCLRGNRKPEKFQALLQKCTEQLKI